MDTRQPASNAIIDLPPSRIEPTNGDVRKQSSLIKIFPDFPPNSHSGVVGERRGGRTRKERSRRLTELKDNEKNGAHRSIMLLGGWAIILDWFCRHLLHKHRSSTPRSTINEEIPLERIESARRNT